MLDFSKNKDLPSIIDCEPIRCSGNLIFAKYPTFGVKSILLPLAGASLKGQ